MTPHIRLHHRIRMAWRTVFQRHVVEQELDEELRFHLDQLAGRSVPSSPGTENGVRQTRGHVAGIEAVKEACRDMRAIHPLEDVLRDVRCGLRLLRRSPVFSAVAILSLAIGIGLNSAIFTLVHAVVLRPLPVPNPEQLVVAAAGEAGWDADQLDRWFGYPTFSEARDALKGETILAAATSPQLGLIATPGWRPASEPIQGLYQLVSGDYFDLLQQALRAGRLLGPSDDVHLGSHPVAVISDTFWRRHFERSMSAIGAELVLNGTSLTIVGVTSSSFFGTTVAPRTPEVWAPVMMQAAVQHSGNWSSTSPADPSKPWPPQRNIAWLHVFARVTDAGQPARIARALHSGRLADLDEALGARPDPEYERVIRRTRVSLLSASHGLSNLREQASAPLLFLSAMVALLLLIACANLASLLIARAASRTREMAIRLSVGAGRARLVRQLLAESLVVAIAGGALGLLFASWGARVLLVLHTGAGRPPDLDLALSWPIVGFTFAVSLVAALLFGVLPAFRSTRLSPSEVLRTQAWGAAEVLRGRAWLPLGKVLVAGQVAFALLLLVVAGLFARTLHQLTDIDLGIEKDRVAVARLALRAGGYTTDQLPALYRRLIERASAIPGVTSASVSLFGPLYGGYQSGSFGVEGYQPVEGEQLNARFELVSSAHLQTLRVPLVEGRYFSERDVATKRRVAIINETMARRYFRNRSSIGQRWSYDRVFTPHDAFEIIGVVKDARYNDLRSQVSNMVFLPMSVHEDSYLHSLEVRSTRPAHAMAQDLRVALLEIEPGLPLVDITSIRARAEAMAGTDRLVAYLTVVFGAVALLLACLGQYGTISYAVSRRTSELGVRMALGAGRASVIWLVLREAIVLLAVGLVLGLPFTYAAARSVSHLLYGVQPTDPTAVASAILKAARRGRRPTTIRSTTARSRCAGRWPARAMSPPSRWRR